MYVKGREETSLLIVCLYVDDFMLTGSKVQDIEEFKSVMKSEFEMAGLGILHISYEWRFSKPQKA